MDERARLADLKRSWEWLRFASDLPSRAYEFNGLSASTQLLNGRYIVTGAVLNNTATTPGVFTAYDGQDTAGANVLIQRFTATSTDIVPAPGKGVLCEIGVFIAVTAGSVSGAVYAIPLSELLNTPPGE